MNCCLLIWSRMCHRDSKTKFQLQLHLLTFRIAEWWCLVDCTDIEVVTPKRMDLQRLTNCINRSMNSFKAFVEVAPNDVITFVRKLCAGSTSVKHIVQTCGILDHFVAGDLILADKGFLIQNVVPAGVSFNIPPFLEHRKLSKNEINSN